MDKDRSIRINKILREQNISLENAVGILKRHGIAVDADPNIKISKSEVEIIENFFNKPEIIRKIEVRYNTVLLNRDELKDRYGFNFFRINEQGQLIDLDILNTIDFDLDDLKGEKQLAYLSLIDVKILNSGVLRYLSELKELHLGNNRCDYSSIKNLKKLLVLSISEAKIPEFNFLPLSIKALTLTKCNISDLAFLKKLKNLSSLNLSENKITDITVLESFSDFDELTLSNNLIEDISSLKNIKFNNSLYLTSNKIFDLTPLYHEFKRGKMFVNYNSNPVIYPPEKYERLQEYEKWRWFEESLDRAREKIKKAKENHSKILNLGGCGLTDLELLPELFQDTEFIEELILSNQYAKYSSDENVWIQEKTEGFYPNNICHIPEAITKLKNLKVLITGGDWRDNNNTRQWRIKDAGFLSKLTSLKIVNISNNMIESLLGLNKLKQLESLHANNNLIEQISPLKGLKLLREIYLSNNEIEDLSFLKDVKSLETLDLHHNLITDISPIEDIIYKIGIEDSKWLVGTVCIRENNVDESFLNILKEKSDNLVKRQKIENYFKRLKQGDYIEINKLKLVLLGNTGAGKTTLADILADSSKASNGSTHGVNFFDYEVGSIAIKGYDFGGQDYYHNTHYSFFDNRALYILVWGNGQKDEFDVKDEEIFFPLNYWLGSLNVFTYKETVQNFYQQLLVLRQQSGFKGEKELNNLLAEFHVPAISDEFSPADIDNFLVETRISLNSFKKIKDLISEKINHAFSEESFLFNSLLIQNVNQNKIWINELDIIEKFRFISDFNTFNFFGDKDGIKTALSTIAEKFSDKTKQLAIDYELGLTLESNKAEIILYRRDVRNLKEEIASYDDQELESLLQSLHSTLSCYYFKIDDQIRHKLANEELDDIVIVDIEQFTDWIYKIFEQKSAKSSSQENEKIRSKGKEGYFDKANAVKWINDPRAEGYIDYILAFMLKNKMIFKMRDHECFFAPNYLPDVQTQTEELFLNSFEPAIVKYVFNGHFHTSVMSEIIDKYLDNLMYENTKMKYVLWKNKVLLFEDNDQKSKLVYLHLDVKPGSDPTISISRYNNSVSDQFILEILNFIERIIKNYDYKKILLSSNGRYVPYDIIDTEYLSDEAKKVNLFSFENIIYRRSDFKLFLKHNNNYPMKKIFISYSKDDLVMVNQFLDHLEPLRRDGLIATWYCTELIAGGEWDKDIQQNFDESDIICFMVSPNLMRTDYVFNHEIKKAIERRKKDEDFKIVPIILNYCSWITKDYNLGDYTALPYTAKPVSDFIDKDMAWYIITECIKILIKSTKQPQGENWYGNKLPKDVRKIYERIVQNKVDKNS